jgi:hypothetical protein
MNLVEHQKKIQNYGTLLKWVVGISVLAVAAPIMVLALKSVVAIALTGIIALASVHFAPVLQMKFVNWKLQAIKAEARKNPIETMQAVYAQKIEEKKQFKDRITTFRAVLSDIKSKLQIFREKYPKDAEAFEAKVDIGKKRLVQREARYQNIKLALKEYAGVIERANAIWEMSNAMAALDEADAKMMDDLMSKIKVETSLDSVTHNMNQVFAAMETDLLDGDDLDKLVVQEVGYSPADNFQSVTLVDRQKVYAERKS